MKLHLPLCFRLSVLTLVLFVLHGCAGTEGKLTSTDRGYRAFKIVEGGAVATVTIRLAHATPYLKQPER